MPKPRNHACTSFGLEMTFPIPTIGIKKSLGTMLIAAGSVKERMNHIHVADVYSSLQNVNKELQKLQQKSV